MKQTELNNLIKAGIDALGMGEPLKALALLKQAADIELTPTVKSSLAYCMARERGQIKSGRLTCEELIESDPENPFHYLNLGRIMLLEEDRIAAIGAFRAGMDLSPHPHIIRELTLLGVRKPRVINFLHRDNPLNKYLGLISGWLGARSLDRD